MWINALILCGDWEPRRVPSIHDGWRRGGRGKETGVVIEKEFF